MIFLLLLALWLIPILTYRRVRRLAPDRMWRSTGFALGLVVSPASLGLYSLYWWAGSLAVLGWPVAMLLGWPIAMLGIAGLMLAELHGSPGFYIATGLGIIERGVVVQGVQHFYLGIVDGVMWAIVYGTIGWVVDSWRAVSVGTEAA